MVWFPLRILQFKMRTLWVYFALVLGGLCLAALAAPAQRYTATDPELSGGFFEGDMEVDSTRNGMLNTTKHWPKGIVYYKIEENMFEDYHIRYIKMGMQYIELASCIRFQQADEQAEAYVRITSESTGCSSKVGYTGGLQRVNLQLYPLDSGCFRLGTIQHELLHSLGFHHQQSAPDRDDYVYIAEENILEGKEHNFKKYESTEVGDYDASYDYGSVMHYSSFAFSKNNEETIVPLRPTDKIMGQRLSMSQTDVIRLNTMYKCPIQI